MKKFILIALALSAFVFVQASVEPYSPDTFKPSHPVGIEF